MESHRDSKEMLSVQIDEYILKILVVVFYKDLKQLYTPNRPYWPCINGTERTILALFTQVLTLSVVYFFKTSMWAWLNVG